MSLILECFRFGSDACCCVALFDFFRLHLLIVSSIVNNSRKNTSRIGSMSLAADISKYDALIDFAKFIPSFRLICRLWLKSILLPIIVKLASLFFRFFKNCDKFVMYSKLFRFVTEKTRMIESAQLHRSSFWKRNEKGFRICKMRSSGMLDHVSFISESETEKIVRLLYFKAGSDSKSLRKRSFTPRGKLLRK